MSNGNSEQGPYDPSPEDPVGLAAQFLLNPPKWLILGGLGDVDEVGPAVKRWPGLRVIGVDPDPRAVRWQLEHSWPAPAPLLQQALSDRSGWGLINMSTVCCASMNPQKLAEVPREQLVKVLTTTLDDLHGLHGFEDAVLWLDVEGHERWVLLGGEELLRGKDVMLICTEVWYSQEDEGRRVNSLLEGWGWERVWVWFRQRWGHNEFWMRRDRHPKQEEKP